MVRQLDLFAEAVPAGFREFESQGIRIAVASEAAAEMRGLIIDYQETSLGAGFVFHE